MMTNLFSIFDPSLSMFGSSWVVFLFCLILLPGFYWLNSTYSLFFHSMFNMSKVEIDYVISHPFKGAYKFIGSIFLTICLFNFLALFPHIFSLTSHMLVTLPFSFSFWFCIVLFSWVNFMYHFLSHLIPAGTPLGLISFMVLVELMSNFIRPIALTFRLTANMMAGHLLMSLIGGALISLQFSFMVVGSLFQSLLVFMELGVSVIQAYVFSTLLLLYLSEGEQH